MSVILLFERSLMFTFVDEGYNIVTYHSITGIYYPKPI